MTDPISAISPQARSTRAEGTTTKNSLSQEDFMRLLTAQLSNQDPLEPMDNTQFLAQLAQFTALQQTTDISQTLTGFASSFSQVSAMNFLGKNVVLKDTDGLEVTGIVSKVSTKDGIPYVTIGEKKYEAYRVFSVATPPVTPSVTPPTTP